MTTPHLAWAYSELNKSVQFPGKNRIFATEYVLSYLHGTWNQTIRYSRDSHENPNVFWGWVDADWGGDTDTRRSHTENILMMNGGHISWESRRKITCRFPLPRLNLLQLAKDAKKRFTCVKRSLTLDMLKLKPLFSMKTILPALL